ncbi:transcription antitermination factor NusB [Oceanivirga salmonicida]|uniref:transcription antitermination factor NusB n=1 Tax=Oceanivirga salmonicida TaxID=1769291 RepID=UPI00082D3424|nr:transcription antitermination factor NusB [Oceanivirga salmonicida]
MEQRALRIEIFKILFEYEVMKNDVYNKRIENFLKENKLNKSKTDFFISYIKDCIEKENDLIDLIKIKLSGWTYERLGVVERTLLKMSFYEIEIKDIGYEIVINETLEIAKIYGDTKTNKFLNGILAELVKGK